MARDSACQLEFPYRRWWYPTELLALRLNGPLIGPCMAPEWNLKALEWTLNGPWPGTALERRGLLNGPLMDPEWPLERPLNGPLNGP